MVDGFIANLPLHGAPDEESNVDAMVIADEDTMQGVAHNTSNSGSGQWIASSSDLA
jgi:hypothetical protein